MVLFEKKSSTHQHSIMGVINVVAKHAFDGELVLHMFINDEEYQVCFNVQ